MNISITSLEKKHFPVMLDEVVQICNPSKKNQLVLDCTFGGGGYSKELLKFPNIKVIALDRDKSAIERAEVLRKKSPKKFTFYNEKFSNLDKIINLKTKPDVIVFDLGLSTFQLKDYSRGFSFNATDKIDMRMGLSDTSAEKVINTLDEHSLKLVIKILGEEQEANRIVKNIIKVRQIKKIDTVTELVKIIESSKKKNFNKKINVCTKTFQALRIFVNQEVSELIKGITEATKALKPGGTLIIISFHSIEDKIVKFYFKNYSSNKSKGSRYLPEANKEDLSLFENYRNKIITASAKEIKINLPSRSAKLRFATRNNKHIQNFIELNQKFENYLRTESLNV